MARRTQPDTVERQELSQAIVNIQQVSAFPPFSLRSSFWRCLSSSLPLPLHPVFVYPTEFVRQVCDEITQKRKSEKLRYLFNRIKTECPAQRNPTPNSYSMIHRKMVVTISKEVFNDEVNIIAPHRFVLRSCVCQVTKTKSHKSSISLFVRAGTCQFIKDPKSVGIFQSHIKVLGLVSCISFSFCSLFLLSP